MEPTAQEPPLKRARGGALSKPALASGQFIPTGFTGDERARRRAQGNWLAFVHIQLPGLREAPASPAAPPLQGLVAYGDDSDSEGEQELDDAAATLASLARAACDEAAAHAPPGVPMKRRAGPPSLAGSTARLKTNPTSSVRSVEILLCCLASRSNSSPRHLRVPFETRHESWSDGAGPASSATCMCGLGPSRHPPQRPISKIHVFLTSVFCNLDFRPKTWIFRLNPLEHGFSNSDRPTKNWETARPKPYHFGRPRDRRSNSSFKKKKTEMDVTQETKRINEDAPVQATVLKSGDAGSLEDAGRRLRDGGLVAFPTETVRQKAWVMQV